MRQNPKSEFRSRGRETPRGQGGNPKSGVILFAVTGMSPAIITETVWALAQETPPIIPDRVVVVTTTAGRDAIRRELFAGKGPSGTGQAESGKRKADGVWDQLLSALAASHLPLAAKLRFGTTGDDIRVFTRADARGRSIELDDIRMPADNEAAADFLLDALRPFTENPDARLVCSLAGGRKTMGALLYACLSVLGREDDRLTHVLVNEPFDDPRLQPRFYFPTSPPTLHHPSTASRRVSSAAADIQLADVPFVPLRRLFPKELGRMPGRFMNLVAQYRATIAELSAPPRVAFGEDDAVVRVDDLAVRLCPSALGLLDFLVQRARAGEPAFSSFKLAVDPFRQFLGQWGKGHGPFHFRNHDSLKKLAATLTEDNLRKLALTIKRSLLEGGLPTPTVQHLVPHRGCFGVHVQRR